MGPFADRFIPSFIVSLSILTAPLLAERIPSQLPMDESTGRREVLSPAWEVGVQDDLAAREYWVTWQDRTQLDDLREAWHAPNRAQGFRTYFTPDGIRVVPRTSDQPAWQWGLSLVGYGRGGTSHPVEPARLFPDENRIRLDRRDLDEWFVNEPRGLKHGFVLHAPPEPIDRRGIVHLDLMVGGILNPVLGTGGQSVRFVASSGLATVYYRGLEVRDVMGRVLPTWMEAYVASGVWTIRLLVDDGEADYPVTIDPLATTAAWIGEIDQAGARFGIDVDTAG